MRQWARRAAALHEELAEIADVTRDPRWWLVAGGAALAWHERRTYIASDAEPSGDTFIGHVARPATDPFLEALARAYAARAALRELDGELPEQPLSVTMRRGPDGAVPVPSKLDVAAFALGARVVHLRLGDNLEADLPRLEAAIARGERSTKVPFVTVTLGTEPIETARHGHRRAWATNGVASGPWLGLSRSQDLAIVSTCHMVVDGFGHAWLSARIAELAQRLLAARHSVHHAADRARSIETPTLVPGSIPLSVSWRSLPGPAPRALPLAYALGRLLHRLAGRSDAPFSPTFQIPVAPGDVGDPLRFRQRVIPAIASVRFADGKPEPFSVFAERTREILARDAAGDGLASRLLAAAQAVPTPLAWKRRAASAGRPRWLDAFANVIGGRGCLSRIQLDVPVPPSCAVSSPAQLATASDRFGGNVVTVIDDRTRAAITLCGSGRAAAPDLLDELLALLPPR